jgi:muconate cycloisomerase
LKSIYGSDLNIQLDIGGNWQAEDALEQIPILLDRGISVFEQPFATDQDLRMAKLQKRYKGHAEFVADESIVNYKDAVRLIKTEACSRFNLKISKHGGIFQTLAIYRLATQYGISCELGTHPGATGLLGRIGILFSSMAPGLISRERGLAELELSRDICHKAIPMDTYGNLQVPRDLLERSSPVDALRLDKYSARSPFVA